MKRVVVDTNIWIRISLAGPVTLPILGGDPLPHQIIAVYESMLPRQPLRFLLADDPGAGKTIMARLLIKELIARGDLKRCLGKRRPASQEQQDLFGGE